MTSVIVGSTAIRYHFPDFPREPGDVDVFSPSDNPTFGVDIANGKRLDIFWDPRLDNWYWMGPQVIPGKATRPLLIATIDELYTIKVSHAAWDVHGTWGKHMHDIVFLRDRGAQFIRPLYDILFAIWKDTHGKKQTNLNQTKDDFFSDAVTRIYDHDSIHDSVAYGERPLYESILRDGAEVAVDWSKFEAMSYEDKLKLCREEIYATALERWVIPSDYTCSPRGAYAQALKKTITSLFKNDWALFIVLNYKELRDPDMDYVAHHKSNSHRLIKL